MTRLVPIRCGCRGFLEEDAHYHGENEDLMCTHKHLIKGTELMHISSERLGAFSSTLADVKVEESPLVL